MNCSDVSSVRQYLLYEVPTLVHLVRCTLFANGRYDYGIAVNDY